MAKSETLTIATVAICQLDLLDNAKLLFCMVAKVQNSHRVSKISYTAISSI